MTGQGGRGTAVRPDGTNHGAPAGRRRGRIHQERAAMHDQNRGTRAYVEPRLKVYGTVADITLTVNLNMNKNDSVQGGNNLKT
jgi:hypothetical protein